MLNLVDATQVDVYFYNVSVYKIQPPIDQELTPISFLNKKVQVASETPQTLEDAEIPLEVVAGDILSSGTLEVAGKFITRGGMEVVVVDDNYTDLDAIVQQQVLTILLTWTQVKKPTGYKHKNYIAKGEWK